MRKRLMIIFGLVVLILLIFILLPDSFFKKHSKYSWFYENDFGKNNEPIKTNWSVPIDKMINDLLKNNYEYSYSLENRSYKYECSGKKEGEKESGSCTSPEEVKYDNSNFNDVFNKVNTKYLDVNYVNDLIKDKDGEVTQYQNSRMHYYNVISNDVETEIYIYTNQESIFKIIVMNNYLTYVLNYSNIKS